jgi:hypothetical protein
LDARPTGSIDLHHDLRIKVRSDVESEVIVRRAGKAIVADHSVSEEVAGCRREIEHRNLDIQSSDRSDLTSLVSLYFVAND